MRDGTADPIPRDQILRRKRGPGNFTVGMSDTDSIGGLWLIVLIDQMMDVAGRLDKLYTCFLL